MPDSSDVTGAAVQVRLRGPLFAELENWRRAQPKIVPRSWALRIRPRRGGGNSRARADRNPAAIYVGRRFLGVVLPHGKTAFRAINCDERLIGVFTSRHEAAIAIMRGVP